MSGGRGYEGGRTRMGTKLRCALKSCLDREAVSCRRFTSRSPLNLFSCPVVSSNPYNTDTIKRTTQQLSATICHQPMTACTL
eukprot:scaffold783_cov197-Alexandrium_tamarense.AAC.29